MFGQELSRSILFCNFAISCQYLLGISPHPSAPPTVPSIHVFFFAACWTSSPGSGVLRLCSHTFSIFCDLRRKRPGSVSTTTHTSPAQKRLRLEKPRKKTNQARLSSIFPSATSKVKKTILPTMAVTLTKGSTRPPVSLLIYSQQGGTKRKERRPSLLRLTLFRLYPNYIKNHSKGLVAQIPSPFLFSLTTSPICREREGRGEGGGRSPATLSSPNTHPSFLGREGPLPCGSSVPLARAPNPRERARPLHSTNPA